MSNPFDEINQAVSQAHAQLEAVDKSCNSMARLLVGRMRHVTWSYTLIALKKELRDLDARTGKWKEPK